MNTLKAILNFSYVSPQYSLIALATVCYSISSHKDLSKLFFLQTPRESTGSMCASIPSCKQQSHRSLLVALFSQFQPVRLFQWENSPEGCQACGSSSPQDLSRALQDRPCLPGTPCFLMTFFSQRSHGLFSRNKVLRFLP